MAGIASMAAICSIRAWFGSMPILRHAVDDMVALDGAWRVLSGQRPHVDYYSALGPVSSFIYAFGLALAHNGVNGLNYGAAVFGFLLGLWAFAIARRRVAAPWAALIAISYALLIVAPAALGEPYYWTGESMYYNRYGYALTGIILMEAWLAPEEGSHALAEGVSTGLACGLLLFLKVSYFLVAAPLILVLLVVRRQSRARIAGIAFGFCAVTGVIMAWLGFHVGAVIQDLRTAAGARSERMALTRAGDYLLTVRRTLLSNVAVIAMAIFAGLAAMEKRGGWRSAVRAWFAPILGVALVVGAGMAIIVSNTQLSAMPLNGLFAILLADRAIRGVSSRKDWSGATRLSVCAAFALCALCVSVPLMIFNARALAFGLHESGVPADSPAVSRIHSGVMRGFRIMGASEPWMTGRAYVDEINEGIDLLERWSPPTETVYSLAYTNTFSYALERRPARGGSTWLHPMVNFSDRYKPSAEWLMGQADVLMVPKCPGVFRTDYVLRNYSWYVKERFHLIAESPNWALYRRNQR